MNLNQIKTQVKRVLEYSQKQCGLNVDQLIDSWETAKREYIYFFGESLIYEYPEKVNFELSREEKEQRVEDFALFVENQYGNYDLKSFIIDNIDCFFSNNLTRDYHTITSNYEPVDIQSGTKMVKAFKYFEKDKDILEILQNKASTIIQEDKISGTLCLSVHPLDYLSLSENNYNWRSCHALDGDYRSGNLSYMVDNCTVICYLKSDKESVLPRFPKDIPWNDKKWRVLLFIPENKSMLFLGRQYPFNINKAPEFITEKLLPQTNLFYSSACWTEWTSDTVRNVEVNDQTFFLRKKYIPVGGLLKSYQDLIINGENALNFNDLLNSSFYTPMYCYTLYQDEFSYVYNNKYRTYGQPDTKFVIGGPVKCLKCGEKPITNGATIFCDDCEETYGNLNDEEFTYCHVCGRHVSTNHGTWVDDDFVCDDCSDEIYECDRCGRLMLREDACYLTDNNDRVYRTLCHYCYYED